jgi:ABC-type glycerol-3-phosphate transport system permease component
MNKFSIIALYIILVLFGIVMILPFVWSVSSSFKDIGEIFNYPPTLIPNNPIITNYVNLIHNTKFVRWYINSLFITVIYTLSSVFLSALGGYGFAKYNFRGKSLLFSILIGSMIIPSQLTLVPMFLMINRLKLVDSYLALILPGLAPAFGIFLMRQFMVMSIPDELLDAGRIDGCPELSMFNKIVLPLAKPAIGALTIYQFIGSWNSFLWPLIVLRTEAKFTLPIGLANLLGLYVREYGIVMAGSTLVILLPITLFLMMQRQFISGLTLGAVKG